MGQGITAYKSFLRIHEEMGSTLPPQWDSLTHIGRMAWEAAAQAVAAQFQPVFFEVDAFDEEESDPIEDEYLEDLELPLEPPQENAA